MMPILGRVGKSGKIPTFAHGVCVHTDTASTVGGWGTNYTKILPDFNTGHVLPCNICSTHHSSESSAARQSGPGLPDLGSAFGAEKPLVATWRLIGDSFFRIWCFLRVFRTGLATIKRHSTVYAAAGGGGRESIV